MYSGRDYDYPLGNDPLKHVYCYMWYRDLFSLGIRDRYFSFGKTYEASLDFGKSTSVQNQQFVFVC